MSALTAPATEHEVWSWLEQVPDPEIPAISIVDLGIVRDVRRDGEGRLVVTVTPTYSGCPATEVIAQSIRDALHGHGVENAIVRQQLAPAWTTDWLAPEAKDKLRRYGIAPPAEQVVDISRITRRAPHAPVVCCPQCGSADTALTSAFGSTPCKALYRCRACREPFDYFKCH